jgi:ABC-2 type transport system permease protein
MNLNKKLKSIIDVIKREVGIIIKDRDLIIILLISPIFYAFFYASFYMYKTEANVPVVIVDNDHTETSRTFIRFLDSHQLVEVKETVPDYATAQDRIYKMSAFGIINIPERFEANLKSGQGADLGVYLNTSRFLISNDINKAINEVVGYMNAGIKLHFFESQGLSFEQAKEVIEPVSADVKPLFNPTEAYGDFLLPGLLILILQQTLLMGLAQSMAKENEEKTLKDLYSTAGHSMWATITGKGFFYFALYAAYALFIFAGPFSIFKINLKGNYFALAVMTALLFISVIYISIFIASFFDRKIYSLQFFVFTSYPVFLASGYAWPLISMPTSIKLLTQLLPSTPFLNAYVRITQMGGSWQHIFPEFIHLAALTLIGLILTRIRLKIFIKKQNLGPVTSPVFKLAKMFGK